jgi:phage terminase large subunit-like protein
MEMDLKKIDAITFDEFLTRLINKLSAVERKYLKLEGLTLEQSKKVFLERLDNEQLNGLLRYKRELEDLEQDYGILYYKPQHYQEKFHKSLKKTRLVLGGNQTGKTEVGVAEDLRIALGIDPYKHIPDEMYPLRMRVCCSDLSKGLNEVVIPKFKKMIPMSEVKRIQKYPQGYWQKVEFVNGTTIEFLSYEQDTKLYEGWTGHVVHFDEPPPYDKYVATMRGLMRFSGISFITATPLSEPWIYDEIYLRALNGDDKTDLFCFSLMDNKYLSKDEIEEFIRIIPDDEKEARIYGKFKHLTGLVYKEFSAEHCIDSFEIPKDWTVICACDYHPRKACCFLWVAIDKYDRAYVIDEMLVQGTIKSISEKIVLKEQNMPRVRYRFIDSISATPDRISGTCAQREIAREGNLLGHPLTFRASTKNFVIGKNAVSEYLKFADGKPGIYFFKDKCPKLIESMGRYTWAGANTEAGQNERPRKMYDDMPDCLRYALVLRPRYVNKVVNIELSDNEPLADDYTGYHLGE